MHGNSGQIQTPKGDTVYYGWGLDLNVAGTGPWLHYSIPSIEGQNNLEAIRIRFVIYRPLEGWVNAIHIWNGDEIIEKFENQMYGDKPAGGGVTTTDMIMPLTNGPVKTPYGVGISILPQTKEAGGLKSIVRMNITDVCAIYVFP